MMVCELFSAGLEVAMKVVKGKKFIRRLPNEGFRLYIDVFSGKRGFRATFFGFI